MATVGLEKPGALSGSAVLTGGDLGTTGTSFYIKVSAAQLSFSTNTADTTGDGDIGPEFRHNCLLYGQITLYGHMVTAAVPGLLNMIDGGTDVTPPKNPFEMVFNLGGSRSFKCQVLVSSMRFDWRRDGATIPVVFQLVKTGDIGAVDFDEDFSP